MQCRDDRSFVLALVVVGTEEPVQPLATVERLGRRIERSWQRGTAPAPWARRPMALRVLW